MQFEHARQMKPVPIYTSEGHWSIWLEVIDNHPFIHFENFTPSISAVKKAKEMLAGLKTFLKAVGYPYVFGAILEENEHGLEFFKKFGLKEIARHENLIYLVLETEPEGDT